MNAYWRGLSKWLLHHYWWSNKISHQQHCKISGKKETRLSTLLVPTLMIVVPQASPQGCAMRRSCLTVISHPKSHSTTFWLTCCPKLWFHITPSFLLHQVSFLQWHVSVVPSWLLCSQVIVSGNVQVCLNPPSAMWSCSIHHSPIILWVFPSSAPCSEPGMQITFLLTCPLLQLSDPPLRTAITVSLHAPFVPHRPVSLLLPPFPIWYEDAASRLSWSILLLLIHQNISS